jgi:phenylalanyl-tRNA synthetase alpha chain
MEVPQVLLEALANGQPSIKTIEFAEKLGVDHQVVVGAMKSIQATAGDCLEAEVVSKQALGLTAEGEMMVEHGSHEARVFNAIPEGGIPQSQLMVRARRLQNPHLVFVITYFL